MAKTPTTSTAQDTGAVDQEQPAAVPGPDSPEPVTAPADSGDADSPEQQPPGVYEYVHGVGCVYPSVPLTCHAYHPAVAATDTAAEIPERPATVFEWPEGPPSDGRWVKTRKKPNQVADNAGGLLSGKE